MDHTILRLLDSNDSIIKQIIEIDNVMPLEWDKSYNPTPLSVGSEYYIFKNDLRHNDKTCYYCCDNDTVISFIIFSRLFHDTIKINSLWTHPSFRMMGYATRLKLYFEEWCTLHGIEFIQSHVNSNNDKMRNLNLKLGYSQKTEVMEKKLR